LGARFAAREGKGGERHHGHFSEHVSELAFKRFVAAALSRERVSRRLFSPSNVSNFRGVPRGAASAVPTQTCRTRRRLDDNYFRIPKIEGESAKIILSM